MKYAALFAFPDFVDTEKCLTVSPCRGIATCNNTITQLIQYSCKLNDNMLCYFSNSNFVDTNECLIVSPCHANATCNNTEGSYTCTCDSGYFGDGVLCNGRRLKCLRHS